MGLLSRLRILFLNNNMISKIGSNLEKYIPNLETLILARNKIQRFKLSRFEKLKCLSLIVNPISNTTNYRSFVISRCKCLNLLDFIKVKINEREKAEKVIFQEIV